MIIGGKENQATLMDLMPAIKTNPDEWQIVTAKLTDKGAVQLGMALDRLMRVNANREGVVFPVGNYKAVMVVKMGKVENYALLKAEVESTLSQYQARVMVRRINELSLKQLERDFLDDESASGQLSFYKEREQRGENVIMIADDDLFVRSTLRTTLADYGRVCEVGQGSQVGAQYLNHNPDVLLLDIHMPGKDGLSVVDEIIEMDSDAYIIVFSSDSVKKNVLDAISKGASGFLSKPVKKDKLVGYLQQSITFC